VSDNTLPHVYRGKRLTAAQKLELLWALYGFGRDGGPDVEYGSLAALAGVIACPWGESLHFNHDGCPACASEEEGATAPEPGEADAQAACGLALEHGRLLEEAATLWPARHHMVCGCDYLYEGEPERKCPNPYRTKPEAP
jgi:hypothetical protein